MEITPNKSFHYVVIKIIFVIYISDQLNLQVLVRYICLNNSCLILFSSAHKTPHYTIKRIYSFAYFIFFILCISYAFILLYLYVLCIYYSFFCLSCLFTYVFILFIIVCINFFCLT